MDRVSNKHRLDSFIGNFAGRLKKLTMIITGQLKVKSKKNGILAESPLNKNILPPWFNYVLGGVILLY